MRSLSGATSQEDVPFNRKSCDAWMGCPFQTRCTAFKGAQVQLTAEEKALFDDLGGVTAPSSVTPPPIQTPDSTRVLPPAELPAPMPGQAKRSAIDIPKPARKPKATTLQMTPGLRPFWRYYGGKWRAAPRYPAPLFATIIEPFAGAAGYSMRYADRRVILVDCYPVVAEMWRYLIGTPGSEVRRIPLVDSVAELPAWVPQGARYLVGFAMNAATVAPCRVLSSGRKKLRALGHSLEGWSEQMRERVARQVDHIRHWRIVEASYTDIESPKIKATWFVDPPYNNRAGSYYVHSTIDYAVLAAWSRALRGQVLVCENEGATWLPFEPFATLKAGINGSGSKEVLWQGGGV